MLSYLAWLLDCCIIAELRLVREKLYALINVVTFAPPLSWYA